MIQILCLVSSFKAGGLTKLTMPRKAEEGKQVQAEEIAAAYPTEPANAVQRLEPSS